VSSDAVLSPLKTALWPLLPKKQDGAGYDQPVFADAGSSDGTAIYNTLAAIDKMPPESRLASVLVLDTTPFGELSGYKAEVPMRSLFAMFVALLEGVGLNCEKADALVPNPNQIFSYASKNATLIELYEAYKEQYSFNKDFARRETEFEIRVPGGPLHSNVGPVIPNGYWSIHGGWNYTVTKVDMDLGYMDDWFLSKLPESYSEALLKKGWPSLGAQRKGITKLSIMLKLNHFDAFAEKAAGEVRAIFYLCLLYHFQDAETGITVECHPGGSVWAAPLTFLTKTLPDAIKHGRPKPPTPKPSKPNNVVVPPVNVSVANTSCLCEL
jgi:hypothetical protein